jgi:hypothetical protein
MSERYDYGRLFLLWHIEEFLAMCRTEIAYPASAETEFRGSEAQMLYSDGDVDVAVTLAVLANPLLIMENGCDDIHRSCGKPFPVIALAQLTLAFLALDDTEAPRLFIYCGRCKTHTFLYILKLLVANSLRGIIPAAVSAFNDL